MTLSKVVTVLHDGGPNASLTPSLQENINDNSFSDLIKVLFWIYHINVEWHIFHPPLHLNSLVTITSFLECALFQSVPLPSRQGKWETGLWAKWEKLPHLCKECPFLTQHGFWAAWKDMMSPHQLQSSEDMIQKGWAAFTDTYIWMSATLDFISEIRMK